MCLDFCYMSKRVRSSRDQILLQILEIKGQTWLNYATCSRKMAIKMLTIQDKLKQDCLQSGVVRP